MSPPHGEPSVLAARLPQFDPRDTPLDNAPIVAYTSTYDRGNQANGTGMHRVSRPDAEPDGHGNLRRNAVGGGLEDQPVQSPGGGHQPGREPTRGTGENSADGRIDAQPQCRTDVRQGLAPAGTRQRPAQPFDQDNRQRSCVDSRGLSGLAKSRGGSQPAPRSGRRRGVEVSCQEASGIIFLARCLYIQV